MFDIFTLASARLIVTLNHWLAASPALYGAAWQLTDQINVLILITLALLWFWPQGKEREYLLPHPETRMPHAKQLRFDWITRLSREASRAQVLVLFLAGTLGLIVARLLAFELSTPQPFATALPMREGVAGAFEKMSLIGSFPAGPAVWLAAMPTALWFWDRRLAIGWAALSVVLAALLVALGFYFPLDLIGGAVIGGLFTYGALSCCRKEGKFARTFLGIARGFDIAAAPYCFILYVLVFLGSIELLMNFQHILESVFTARSEIVARMESGG